MGIILNKDTKVLVQGITGRAGSRHAISMLEYGTRVVGGVRPGAGGGSVHGVPVFDTVSEAVKATGANSSVLFVPPAAALEAALEAIDAGIKLVVAPPENIQLHSEVRMVAAARGAGAILIGPNTAGIIDPALKVKIGFVPEAVFSPVGRIPQVFKPYTVSGCFHMLLHAPSKHLSCKVLIKRGNFFLRERRSICPYLALLKPLLNLLRNPVERHSPPENSFSESVKDTIKLLSLRWVSSLYLVSHQITFPLL